MIQVRLDWFTPSHNPNHVLFPAVDISIALLNIVCSVLKLLYSEELFSENAVKL